MREQASDRIDLSAPEALEDWVHRALRERVEAGRSLLGGRVRFGDPRLESIASVVRAREMDAEVALQKFLEETGLIDPPGIALECRHIALGAVPRGERRVVAFRLHAVGLGILYGEATPIGPSANHVRPLRARFRGPSVTVEFVVVTDRLEVGECRRIPIRFRTNAGVEEGEIEFEVAPRPARVQVEPAEVEIVCDSAKACEASVRVRNLGDTLVEARLSGRDRWMTVVPVGRGEDGREFEWRVRVEPLLLDMADAHRFHKGDYCVAGELEVQVSEARGETERRTVRVRAWKLRPFDMASFLFGTLAGLVPFVNVLIFLVLAGDACLGRVRRQRPTTYRRRAERRDNLSFLMGMVPTLALHLWLVASRL